MKPFALLLAILLLLIAPVSADAQRSRRHRKHNTKVSGKSPKQLRAEIAKLHEKKAALRQELKTTKRKANVVLSDIRDVDERMDAVQNDLDDTTEKLGDSRTEQKTLGKQLAEATTKLAATKVQVQNRLRAIYVRGNGAFISALVGTKSVGDVASRRYLMQTIAKGDRQLFTEYQDLRKKVAQQKQQQDELVVRIGRLAIRQKQAKINLAQVREEKKDTLDGLREKQGQLQHAISQFDADEQQMSDEIAAYARRQHRPGETALPAFHGRFMRPVNAPITSGFGVRYHPILHYTRPHKGVDFGAHAGTPIHAAAAGRVFKSYYSKSFGNVIMIDHGDIYTLYAHCSARLVSEGDTVRQGQVIGRVGATGLAAGAHLHFEVHTRAGAVNPMRYLGG